MTPDWVGGLMNMLCLLFSAAATYCAHPGQKRRRYEKAKLLRHRPSR